MIQRFVKPVNLFKAGYSYLSSSFSGDSRIWGMPLSLSTELTNFCNLACPECLTGSGQMQREKGYMDIALFDKVIKELGPYIYYINLYLHGEPMLHPLFFSFIRHSGKIRSVVSTNGHFLSVENSEKLARSELTKLIISLDGINQKIYSAYRIDGHISTVVEGIRNITEAKSKFRSSLKIEIQFLVHRMNEHQIPQVRQLAKDVKAGLRLKSMQIINKADIEEWLPENDKFRRYEMKNGEYVIKSSLPDRCARLWFNPVITWDGKVLPCCFDKNADHIMGDIRQDSFKDIWDGPKYRIFRKSILTGRRMIDICRNCTSGLRGARD